MIIKGHIMIHVEYDTTDDSVKVAIEGNAEPEIVVPAVEHLVAMVAKGSKNSHEESFKLIVEGARETLKQGDMKIALINEPRQTKPN